MQYLQTIKSMQGKVMMSKLLPVSLALNVVLGLALLMQFRTTGSREAVPAPASPARSPGRDDQAIHGAAPAPRPAAGPDSATGSEVLAVPLDYLGALPNYLVNLDEEIDEFYARKLGMSDADIAATRSALAHYRDQLKALQKTHSRIVREADGSSYLVVEDLSSKISPLVNELRSRLTVLNDRLEPLVGYLINSSPCISRNTGRMELAFTEAYGSPGLVITRQLAGAAPSNETLPLNGSPEQRASLTARFGHLINTDASITEMQGSIEASKERWKFYDEIIKSTFADKNGAP